jgi:hypothetical protein
MDPIDNERAVAQEIMSLARDRGIDVEPICFDGHFFQAHQRFIFFWRKDELPGSGRADEKVGTLRYSMQGTIFELPFSFKDSAEAFHGMWSEAGRLDDIEQAFELLKAWLRDGKEVDQLPARSTNRYGI